MTQFARILARAWMIVPVGACAYLAWSGHVRMQRVDYVSGLVGRASPVDAIDARSPTGYANAQRELIIPERSEDSFHWILQTQQMLAQGVLRVRHVDYENAPFGRDVAPASPYRWWLGLLAWLDHSVSGRPVGLGVERAALYADPLLQMLLVAGAATLAAWRFGGFAAALLSVGLVGLFPLASVFVPGMPDSRGLSAICALGSILALLAGMGAPAGAHDGRSAAGRARPWFALAGVIGGLGMWVSVPTQAPVVLGLFAGALIAARLPGSGVGAAPWRTWGVCGGWTVLAACVAEYVPGPLTSLRLDCVHPLYGVAWLGGGALLARAIPRLKGERSPWPLREVLVVVLAAACVAALPVALWKSDGPGFLARGLQWARLSPMPAGPVAASTWAWLTRDGATLAAWATLLPLAVFVPACMLLFRTAADPRLRASIAVALGPVAVALFYACRQLGWWSLVDVSVLGLIVAAAGEWSIARAGGRWILAALVLAFAVPGLMRLQPQAFAGAATVLTTQESEELVERHLAHWLAKRTGEPGMVVFAPPDETTPLSFYGGLRGIGSFASDNKAGFGNALTIAGARTMEEAEDDFQARKVRYIVMPSWDPFFEDFGRQYLVKEMSARTSFLAHELRRWNLPPWLQPVPYQMPVAAGNGGQSVLVFEVVDPQSPAAAAGRLAEYLVETGDLAGAQSAADRLRRFPGDVGALAARAQAQSAQGDADAVARTVDELMSRLSNGGDRYLAWDRRVSLAVVLARAQKFDASREQVRRCVAEASEARLRSLSTGSLYDLLVLAQSFKIEFADPGLRDLALDLLPGDLRNRL